MSLHSALEACLVTLGHTQPKSTLQGCHEEEIEDNNSLWKNRGEQRPLRTKVGHKTNK